MRLLTAVSGVRVPQQAPESTRKRVLLFCFGLSPLRIQYNQYARVQTRRHAEPQWTRLRRRRTIAIPSRCSLRGFESRGRRHRAPENGCFSFIFRGSHPCACNGTRAGKPADTRNRSGRDCAREGEQSLFRRAAPYRGVEQSCQRQRQNNEPKGKRLRHFTFKVISGACACAGGDGAGEGGGGTGHAPY